MTAMLMSDLKVVALTWMKVASLQDESVARTLEAGQDLHSYVLDPVHVRQEGSHGWQVLTVEF